MSYRREPTEQVLQTVDPKRLNFDPRRSTMATGVQSDKTSREVGLMTVKSSGLKNQPHERQPIEPVEINRPLIATSRVQFHKEYGLYKEIDSTRRLGGHETTRA